MFSCIGRSCAGAWRTIAVWSWINKLPFAPGPRRPEQASSAKLKATLLTLASICRVTPHTGSTSIPFAKLICCCQCWLAAGAPKEPAAAPRLPKVAEGAAVPSPKVGGPAWLLLRREFLACTRGSVGAENGLGPDREGRGAQ